MKRSKAFAFTLALSAITAAPAVSQTRPGSQTQPPSPVVPAATTPSTAPLVDPAVPVALLVDLSSGQTLLERDADRRFVPASVTKVMTAYTAFRLIDDGTLSPDTQLIVDRTTAEKWSGEGSSMFLKAGERLSVRELLIGITTVSANDASVMLANVATGSLDAWLDLMNANAAELGMRDTHFGTPNGWPDEGHTFTTARDLAILAEALTLRYPSLYKSYFGRLTMSHGGITQRNHDPVTGVVDGGDGIKTGFTREAGYNFVGSAEREGRRLVTVVAGAPTPGLRNSTARDLLRWGFDGFETRVVLPGGTIVGEALVQDGALSAVPLQTQGEVLAALPRGAAADISLAIRYRGPVEAPITQGQQVAFLRVAIPGERPHDVPLVAAEAVPVANVWQRLRNGLMGFFT